jgi:regulator of sigma E protease
MSVSGAPGLGLLAYTPSRNLTFFEALWLPVRRTGEVSAQIVVALTRIIIGKEKFTQLGGVISVARISSQIRQWGFDFILGLFASLSITLAIINLLPIPALDGGRILMFTIEKIRRKRFGKRAWTIAVNIGFIIVIALVALTLLNDIFFRS